MEVEQLVADVLVPDPNLNIQLRLDRLQCLQMRLNLILELAILCQTIFFGRLLWRLRGSILLCLDVHALPKRQYSCATVLSPLPLLL